MESRAEDKPSSAGEDVGERVLRDLMQGRTYCDKLAASQSIVEGIQEEMEEGSLPRVFVFNAAADLSPKSPQECLQLLQQLDLSRATHAVKRELLEKVVNYPLAYEAVKAYVVSELGKEAVKEIEKHKKVNSHLFKGLIYVLSRNARVFSRSLVLPHLKQESRMTSTVSLVLARVVMKAHTSREHMEEFVGDILEEEMSPPSATLLTSILIKKLRLSEELVQRTFAYILSGLRGNGRYLLWSKLVLVFLRGYKSLLSAEQLADLEDAVRSQKTTPIEKEILSEISK